MTEKLVKDAVVEAIEEKLAEAEAQAADENFLSESSEQMLQQYNDYMFLARTTASRPKMRNNARRTKILMGRDKIYALLSRFQVQPVSL